jgi:Holliday junction resolvase RusA-like endonuclease
MEKKELICYNDETIVKNGKLLSKKYILTGNPVPLYRPRFSRDHVFDSQKEIKLVMGITIRKQHENLPMFTGPLQAVMRFYMKPPKRNRCFSGRWHTIRPDLSNMLKMIEDVAQGIAYEDDKSICREFIEKKWDINPRVEFIVSVIDDKKERQQNDVNGERKNNPSEQPAILP